MPAPVLVTGHSLGETINRALRQYDLDFPGKATIVTCLDPIDHVIPVDSYDVADWELSLDLGDFHEPFCAYEFGRESPLVGGCTGRDWINDRIVELHDGMYADRLGDPDRIEMITDRLQHGHHGSTTNALVVQVFQLEDLERACVPRPQNSNMAYVTEL